MTQRSIGYGRKPHRCCYCGRRHDQPFMPIIPVGTRPLETELCCTCGTLYWRRFPVYRVAKFQYVIQAMADTVTIHSEVPYQNGYREFRVHKKLAWRKLKEARRFLQGYEHGKG